MKKYRIFLILLGALFTALVIQLLVYHFNFTTESISNSLFVIGVILFFTSLIALSGSYEIFHGIRYSLQALYRKDFRSNYPTFLEYKTEKAKKFELTGYVEAIIISIVIIAVAFFLASR